jgi:hypothetical protein
VLALVFCAIARAQDGGAAFSKEQLDQLTAQIALYPDALLAQVLMAATYPADVAEAAKWSRAHPDMKGDDAVKMVENEPWDPSVQSLVAFPQVIIMMGEKPDWVQRLGDAFLAQPEDVMDSVQRLRARAKEAGNLNSNEQMKVTLEAAPPPATTTTVIQQAPQQQIIVIQPAQPNVIFVPQYNPTVVFGPWLWPAYPPFYIPPPPGFWFSTAVATGIAWGVGIGVRNALWGGVHWGWGRSTVNINVNNFNNINVNRRLDVNSRTSNWSHNVNNRRDVPYRGGDAQRQRLQDRAGSINREQYRGRDDARARANQAMAERGIQGGQGTARERAQQVDRSAIPNRPQGIDRGTAQDRVQGIDRDAARQRAQSVDRAALQDRAQNVDRDAARQRAQSVDRAALPDRGQGVDRSAIQDRAQSIDRDAARQHAQSVDRSAMQNRAQQMNRDNALRGAGDSNARQQIDRGAASRQAMQQPQQRARGGGGDARPQMQPAAGGARGAGGAGGAGGARAGRGR